MTAPLFLLLDGRSGAGKSSLAASVLRELDDAGVPASPFALEDVYPGWDGLDAAIATLADELIPRWAAGQPAAWTPWDWTADAPAAERRETEPASVVVIEGVGVSSASVTEAIALAGAEAVSVWIEVPDAERKRRALARDGSTYEPHWDRWAAHEDAWLSGPNAPLPADLIADGLGCDPLGPVIAALRPDSAAGRVLRSPWTETSRGRVDLGDDDGLQRLYRRVTRGMPHGVWLDSSMASAGPRNRQILMAAGRLGAEYTASPRGTGLLEVGAPGLRGSRRVPFFDWLSEAWPAGGPSEIAWILQLGYELRSECGTPDIPEPGPADRDARAFWPERLVVADVETGEWTAWSRGAASHQESGPDDRLPLPLAPVFTARDSREDYLERIAACLDEIRLGNSYEVCLTTALTADVPGPGGDDRHSGAASLDALDVFTRLRRRSPAPFGAYLRMSAGGEGDFALIGSSPERFLSVDADGTVTAEPIKGTRPRGATPAEDARLKADLAASAKDRAENIMIVDLLRNDLGATARPGSVRVDRLCDIEEYATVFQMVSTVRAQARPGVRRGDLLRAAFPPGSMTGCPKISTMSILGRLEGERRGAYSGSVGYTRWDGSGDFNVVIRSLEVLPPGAADGRQAEGGRQMRLGLGGAITIGSHPAAEWDEVRAKSAGVLGALGARFPDDPG